MEIGRLAALVVCISLVVVWTPNQNGVNPTPIKHEPKVSIPEFKQSKERPLSVLITGANGYIGSHVVSMLNDRLTPVELDILVYRERLELKDPAKIYTAVQSFAPHVVIHLAALSSPSLCESNPDLAHAVNIAGTEHLASAFAQLFSAGEISLFIFFSTDWVYEGNDNINYTEVHRSPGFGVYGKSKTLAEQKLSSILGEHALILRTALVYGSPSPTDPRKTSSIGWVKTSLIQSKPIQAYTDEYRTPIYIGDITKLLFYLLKQIKSATYSKQNESSEESSKILTNSHANSAFNSLTFYSLLSLGKNNDCHLFSKKGTQSQNHKRKSQQLVLQKEPTKAIGIEQHPFRDQEINHNEDSDFYADCFYEHQALVFNLGGPECISRFDMALLVAKILGQSPSFVQPSSINNLSKVATKRPPRLCMNSSLLWSTVGMDPRHPHDGIRYSLLMN